MAGDGIRNIGGLASGLTALIGLVVLGVTLVNKWNGLEGRVEALEESAAPEPQDNLEQKVADLEGRLQALAAATAKDSKEQTESATRWHRLEERVGALEARSEDGEGGREQNTLSPDVERRLSALEARGDPRDRLAVVEARQGRLESRLDALVRRLDDLARAPGSTERPPPSQEEEPDTKAGTKSYAAGAAKLEVFLATALERLPESRFGELWKDDLDTFKLANALRCGRGSASFLVPSRYDELGYGTPYVGRFTWYLRVERPGTHSFTISHKTRQVRILVDGSEILDAGSHKPAQGSVELKKGHHKIEFLVRDLAGHSPWFTLRLKRPDDLDGKVVEKRDLHLPRE
jgi:hypothetical protein